MEGKTYDDRYDVAKQTREAVMDLISSGSTSSATNGDSPNQEKAEA